MSFLAGVGAGALERLIGNASDLAGTGEALAERKRKDALHDYAQMERLGIANRVEGAKAAGLHPLAALGFQAGPGPSTLVGGGPINSYYQPNPRKDPNLDRINSANADLAETNAARAQVELQQYLNSLHAKASQPGQPPQTTMPTSPSNLTSAGQVKNGVVVEPDKVTAGRDGRTAGTHQGTTDFEMPGGWGITLPSEAASQSMEDMEILKYVTTAIANKDRMARAVLDMVKDLNTINPTLRKREADREVERFKRRFPPKGDYYISPRSRGGVVR